ncbi:MAG: cupredoxin domain-containing protein [Candidatus Nanosalina sp.]
MRKTFLAVFLASLISLGSTTVTNGSQGVPQGCSKITGQENLTVHAGREYAEKFNSRVFSYSDRVYRLEPCVNLTVTLVNHDSIRHQWMVHGLPRHTYPMGMFTVEVDGPGRDTGSFVTPNITETLLVHCGLPQHMQKGMKAMMKINGGDGEISNIPGHTGPREQFKYSYSREEAPILIWTGFGLATGLIAFMLTALYFFRKKNN